MIHTRKTDLHDTPDARTEQGYRDYGFPERSVRAITPAPGYPGLIPDASPRERSIL